MIEIAYISLYTCCFIEKEKLCRISSVTHRCFAEIFAIEPYFVKGVQKHMYQSRSASHICNISAITQDHDLKPRQLVNCQMGNQYNKGSLLSYAASWI